MEAISRPGFLKNIPLDLPILSSLAMVPQLCMWCKKFIAEPNGLNSLNFLHQEFRCNLAGCLWSRVSQRLYSRYQQGCYHLKTRLGEDLLLSSLTCLLARLRATLNLGWRRQFLGYGPHSKGAYQPQGHPASPFLGVYLKEMKLPS